MDHQAFAQLLGNYGEFVGAIAVVATLVYLSMQVRGTSEQVAQGQRVALTQIIQSSLEHSNKWRSMVLEGENTDIWHRGLNDLDALNPLERQKFNMMAGTFDWFCWFTYQQQKQLDALPGVNDHLYRDQFRHPGYRQWMKANLILHTDEYGDFLSEVAQSVGDDALRPGECSSLVPGGY